MGVGPAASDGQVHEQSTPERCRGAGAAGVLAARLPPSIVKGSCSEATDRLLAVLAEARSA